MADFCKFLKIFMEFINIGPVYKRGGQEGCGGGDNLLYHKYGVWYHYLVQGSIKVAKATNKAKNSNSDEG